MRHIVDRIIISLRDSPSVKIVFIISNGRNLLLPCKAYMEFVGQLYG
jgi:hypothetical protein